MDDAVFRDTMQTFKDGQSHFNLLKVEYNWSKLFQRKNEVIFVTIFLINYWVQFFLLFLSFIVTLMMKLIHTRKMSTTRS